MGYFNYKAELRVYRRRLPHWQMAGGVYFVTARLKDAVPPKAVERLKRAYAAEMSKLEARNASTEDYEHIFEWFHLAQVDEVLDSACGDCLLADPKIAEELWESIRHFDGERYELIAVVIMPNHVHVVFRVRDSFTFAQIVGAWKSFTYNVVRRKYGVHLCWQDECFDRLVRDTDELRRVVRYVLDNPAKAGLDNWPWVKQFMVV